MAGLIGKKIGMTSIFSADGRNVPCTIIQAGPCVVTQVKNVETDGYEAVQLGYDDKKEINTTKGELGHFKKAGVTPKFKVVEFQSFEQELALGSEVDVTLFKQGEFVDVSGVTKGKGFQGVVKRHNFGGVGQATHGQHNRLRAPGAIGACSTPARVFKGIKMAGQMGNKRRSIANLEILKVVEEQNLIVVKGSVPGSKNSYVTIEK